MSTLRDRGPSVGRIRTQMRAFDGKDLTPLRSLAARLRPQPDEISRLLGLLPSSEDSIELAATWLVKNLLERGSEPLPATRARRLVLRLLDCRLDWSRLHLLQCLPFAQLGAASRRVLEPALWQWLKTIEHGFTRAWVYDGLVRVSGDDPRTWRRLLESFALSYDEERPAVRARLRQLIRELERRL